MLRRLIIKGLTAGAVACCVAAILGCQTSANGSEESAAPRTEQSSLQSSKPEANALKYTYTWDELFCDNHHSRHIDSLPVLWAHIKWILGEGNDPTSNLMDGEYVYQLPTSSPSIIRYSLRTGKADRIGDLTEKGTWRVNVPWNNTHLDGDTIYLHGARSDANGQNRQGAIWAMAASDGKIKWVRALPMGISHALILRTGKMVVTTKKIDVAQRYCLDKSTGEVLWKLDEERDAVGAIACGENVILANHIKGGLHLRSIETAKGETIWEADVNGESTMRSLVSDGTRIFYGVIQLVAEQKYSPGIIAYDGKTGKEIWRVRCGYDFAMDGSGRIITTEPVDQSLSEPGRTVFLDPATGQTIEKLPIKRSPIVTVGEWAIGQRPAADVAPVQQSIQAFNMKTGEIRTLIDDSRTDAGYSFSVAYGPIYHATDGYLITRYFSRSTKPACACLEDMRFHPDAAKMVLGIKAGEFDDKTMARVADLIGKLGSENPDVKKAAIEELQSLLDLPEEHLASAAKDNTKPDVKEAAEKILKRLNDLRKYLDELGCRKDPIYFTALIRHSADLAIQQKAIDRLKKITAQDFSLKPSAEWIKDQKEVSDKYDGWWLKNRDKLSWSDKEDRYIPRQP